MASRLPSAFLVPLLIFVLPLIGAPEYLRHPAIWLGLVAAFLTLVSQPKVGMQEMVRTAADRYSTILIFACVIGSQLAATIDLAYGSDRTSTSLLAIGTTLAVVGLGLRLWSIGSLGRYFTSAVTVLEDQPVIDRGPYRVLRHPSYTGALITSLGVAIAMRSVIGIALVVLLAVPAYLYRIAVEEAALLDRIGNAYARYSTRTWRLLPYLY